MKSKIPVNRFLLGAFFCSSIGMAFTNVALGNDLQENVVNESNAAPTPTGPVISDGSKIEVKKLGVNINPPQGWEVVTSHPTLSLVIQEPASEKIEYGVPMYRRNITVAAIHKPAPIDEARAKALQTELFESFGRESSVQNFQILEHKFFDYKAKNDGLVMFTSFTTGEFNMMQMHVLVSGEAHQILSTYTDLQERFSNPETYNLAWNSMTSVEVTGLPPARFQSLMMGGAVVLVLFLLVGFISFFKKRKERNSYLADADSVYSDDDADFRVTGSSSMQSFASESAPSEEWDFHSSESPQAQHKTVANNRFTSSQDLGHSFVTGF